MEKKIKFDYYSLLYNGTSNVFLSNFENEPVHMLTTKGQYRFQLLSRWDLKKAPCRLTVENRLLFVGKWGSGVNVFRLFYNEE